MEERVLGKLERRGKAIRNKRYWAIIRQALSEDKPVPPEVAPTQLAKEPWQMTREEWKRGFVEDWQEVEAQRGIRGIGPLGRIHKQRVRQALSEGKPVPSEVLKDYPDLKRKEKERRNNEY